MSNGVSHMSRLEAFWLSFREYPYTHSLLILTMVAFLALVMQMAWWRLYPYQIVKIDSPTPVIGAPVKPGGMVYLNVHYSKFDDVPAFVTRYLANHCLILLTKVDSGGVLRPGVNQNYHIAVPIPPGVPAGRYRVITTVNYKVNPIRIVSTKWESQEFEVLGDQSCKEGKGP